MGKARHDEDVLTDGGPEGFRLVWQVLPYKAEVAAYEIIARDREGAAMLHRQGWSDSMDLVMNTADAEPYLTGFVKWDGCTELDQGQPHWCGPHGYVQHILLLQHIYQRAFELMDRKPEYEWPLQILSADGS